MRAFVTGATGFIGSNLVRELCTRQYKVSCLVRSKANASHLNREKVQLIHGDMLNPESMIEQVSKADIIFHVAGTTKSVNRTGYFHGNLKTTKNLVQVMKHHGPTTQKLIYISTQAAAYPCALEPGIDESTENPCPVSAYGQSKEMAEQEVFSISYRNPVVVLRPSIVYGPRDYEMYPLFKGAAWGILPKSGLRNFPVSIIYVDDLVEAILLTAESDAANNKIFFATDGKTYSWDMINDAIANQVNPSAFTLPIPLPFIWIACQFNGFVAKLTKKPRYLNPDTWFEIKQDGWLCSSLRLQNELEFQPHWSLAEGMKATAEWYKTMGLL